MPIATTLRQIPFELALEHVHEHGAAFVDLRPVEAYLDVHIPGSLSLEYEFGPGLAGRARDCIPLDVPLILLDLDHGDVVNAAASLRGKGFAVLGACDNGLNRWAGSRGTPAFTEVVSGTTLPEGVAVLDVADTGAKAPADAVRIPVDRLWVRVEEVPEGRIAVAAGYGVRAALAVGIVEQRRSPEDLLFWRTR